MILIKTVAKLQEYFIRTIEYYELWIIHMV